MSDRRHSALAAWACVAAILGVSLAPSRSMSATLCPHTDITTAIASARSSGDWDEAERIVDSLKSRPACAKSPMFHYNRAYIHASSIDRHSPEQHGPRACRAAQAYTMALRLQGLGSPDDQLTPSAITRAERLLADLQRECIPAAPPAASVDLYGIVVTGSAVALAVGSAWTLIASFNAVADAEGIAKSARMSGGDQSQRPSFDDARERALTLRVTGLTLTGLTAIATGLTTWHWLNKGSISTVRPVVGAAGNTAGWLLGVNGRF